MSAVLMTAAGHALANRVLGRRQRGEETDTGRYKIGDGLTAWNGLNYAGELPGGGGVQAPTFLVSSAGQTITALTDPMDKVIFEASADIPLRTDQFTLAVDKKSLTCVIAGDYVVDAIMQGGWGNTGAITTPGPIEIESTISVNDESKGPAYNHYPAASMHLTNIAQKCSSAWSFPQKFEIGDKVEFLMRQIRHGSTDPGTAVFRLDQAGTTLRITKQ